MSNHDLHIAVTGLNATDNPGPGVSVLRSLRLAPDFTGELLGLTYDTLDPGIYNRELDLAGSFLIPYPSEGADALLARLRYIHERFRIDVLIPTLDSEFPSLMALQGDLERMGIRMFIPDKAQFDLRSKSRLLDLGRKADIDVPKGKIVMEASEIYRIHEEIPYPFMVKGVFYGASVVHTLDEALAAFHHMVASWGVPVIIQKFHAGEEYDVVAVGDGGGGLVGAVPMKKTFITDKGKGWAGVAVRDHELLAVTERFMAATRWRGPCEIEILKTSEPRYYLIEVNPRFPAWTYLSAGAGQNLPWATARLAAGEDVGVLPDYRPGTMFVRISIDQIATMDDFQAIATTGELVRNQEDES
ncbi:MAG: biotin carboxylase [Deltaproteobacteria bacterium]|nr:biotin carboxylase [Deltaproteobacteria bacterium]